MDAQIELLRGQLAEEEERFTQAIHEEEGRKQQVEEDAAAMSKIRRAESAWNGRNAMAKGA